MTSRWRSLLLLTCCLPPASPAPLVGQSVPAHSASSPVYPFFGIAGGFGTFPGAFDPQCGSGIEGATAAASADIRGGLSRGRWRIEGRVSTHTEIELNDCLYIGPLRPDGTHTYRTSPIERGGFTATDLRVAYALSQHLAYWRMTAGAGWVWRADVPALAFGTGIGLGRTFRAGLDGEVVHYRMPWHVLTADWKGGSVVSVLAREREHDWRRAGSVRLHMEVSLPVRID